MPHPLVEQLRFARHEFQRALEGVSDEDARRRLLPMNCISWNIGHLAWQSKAGKFGSFVIFLGLGVGFLGFIAKFVIQWFLESK